MSQDSLQSKGSSNGAPEKWNESWVAVRDASSGRHYFYHMLTHEKTWNSDLLGQQEWVGVVTQDSPKPLYYYNKTTKETRWSLSDDDSNSDIGGSEQPGSPMFDSSQVRRMRRHTEALPSGMHHRSISQPLSAASDDMTLQEAVDLLMRGQCFLKYGSHRHPHWKLVWVTRSGMVHWVDTGSTKQRGLTAAPPSSMLARKAKGMKLRKVRFLYEGKQTAVFQHMRSGAVPENLCFSLVSHSRSLDLQAHDKGVRDNWVTALQLMLKSIHNTAATLNVHAKNADKKKSKKKPPLSPTLMMNPVLQALVKGKRLDAAGGGKQPNVDAGGADLADNNPPEHSDSDQPEDDEKDKAGPAPAPDRPPAARRVQSSAVPTRSLPPGKAVERAVSHQPSSPQAAAAASSSSISTAPSTPSDKKDNVWGSKQNIFSPPGGYAMLASPANNVPPPKPANIFAASSKPVWSARRASYDATVHNPFSHSGPASLGSVSSTTADRKVSSDSAPDSDTEDELDSISGGGSPPVSAAISPEPLIQPLRPVVQPGSPPQSFAERALGVSERAKSVGVPNVAVECLLNSIARPDAHKDLVGRQVQYIVHSQKRGKQKT